MNWEQIIAMNAPSIIVMIGLLILWLRADITKVARDLNRLEDKFDRDLNRLEDKMDTRLSDGR